MLLGTTQLHTGYLDIQGRDGQSEVHHHTYSSLRDSVSSGSCICERVRDYLLPGERRFISNATRSQFSNESASTGVPSFHSGTKSSHEFATEVSLDKADKFGYPDDYLLQIAFRRIAALPADSSGYWRIMFVLQPIHTDVV
ncbi:hypothetical protein BU25DRAFT_208624 [Macroventuria anomochaeta]|uniref:Uncharacterized protein n=1 Tax=Macroventuria anomochaeta TaxID=301207 RepID=A0ACB6RP00_9PLEO|nr:uncharacterized protein BU25DRAFT_208624 [Macroventuria anomochaeta]KAF2622672.1 hypothetical protein BU25DRAFT_208624 [Macroventuria anomochaeta]